VRRTRRRGTDTVEDILAAGPQPGSLAVLSRIDPARLDEFDRVLYLQACQALAASVAALELRAVAAVAGPQAHPEKLREQSALAEVRAATRLSNRAAHDTVALARALATRLAGTRRALADGRITARHAEVIADATAALDDAAATWVEAQVLPKAATSSVPVTRSAAAEAVLAADPAAAGERGRAARKGRRVERWRRADPAWATLAAHGAPADVETIYAALDAEADSLGREDPRGIDARRFDVLLGWATGTTAPPDTTAPRQVDVQVTIDLPTLLGLREHPGVLAGYGPVAADIARALAAEDGAAWRRLVHEPVTGYALDYGTTTYRPPAALRRYLVARDRTSRFPGESVAARRCDIDHAIPAPAGPTSAANTGALGRSGHRLKTFARWRIRGFPDGRAEWTSPSGHRYWFHPHDYRPHPVRLAAPAGTKETRPAEEVGPGEPPDCFAWHEPPDWIDSIDWHDVTEWQDVAEWLDVTEPPADRPGHDSW
jgi:hypothetical protein